MPFTKCSINILKTYDPYSIFFGLGFLTQIDVLLFAPVVTTHVRVVADHPQYH